MNRGNYLGPTNFYTPTDVDNWPGWSAHEADDYTQLLFTQLRVNYLDLMQQFGLDVQLAHVPVSYPEPVPKEAGLFNAAVYRVAHRNPAAPQLFMLHGIGSFSLRYIVFLKELASYFDIYLMDAPGHGLSDNYPPTFYSVKNISHTLQQVAIKVLDLGNNKRGLQLLAHSGGALPMMHMNNRFNQATISVDKLHLVAPAGLSSELSLIFPALSYKLVIAMLRNEIVFKRRVEATLESYKKAGMEEDKASLLAILNTSAFFRAANAIQSLLSKELNWRGRLNAFSSNELPKTPMNIIIGSEDTYIPSDPIVEHLLKILSPNELINAESPFTTTPVPKARILTVLKGAGHRPFFTHKDQLMKAILGTWWEES